MVKLQVIKAQHRVVDMRDVAFCGIELMSRADVVW